MHWQNSPFPKDRQASQRVLSFVSATEVVVTLLGFSVLRLPKKISLPKWV
jgi:hypothetical protein